MTDDQTDAVIDTVVIDTTETGTDTEADTAAPEVQPPDRTPASRVPCPTPGCRNLIYCNSDHPTNINNQKEFSSLIITHEKPIICNKCDSFFAPVISVQGTPQGLLLTLTLTPIPKPGASPAASDIILANKVPKFPRRLQ